MHRPPRTTKQITSTESRPWLLYYDSTPHNATVRQVFPACPGKPYASAPFGDDPFHHATALRKPKGKVTLDATRLYQIINNFIIKLTKCQPPF